MHSAVVAETFAEGAPNPDALIEDPDLEAAAPPLEDLVEALSPADAERILQLAGAFNPVSDNFEPDPWGPWG